MKTSIKNQRGLIFLVVVLLALTIGTATLFVTAANSNNRKIQRDLVNNEVLQKAKEALLAYATARKMDAFIPMPGTLPCPDLDDDGIADFAGCGNFVGSTQQARRLGRLPWKTLGLEDLRDASGERLWYAVSSQYKDNTANTNLNPSTGLGTITLRNSSGTVILNGVSTDIYNPDVGGAVAIVIAPGAVLQREGEAFIQSRTCVGGSCDTTGKCLTTPPTATPKCNPRNYLDVGLGEDNADFIDRMDSRAGNANGFIEGPIKVSGSTIVNDQIIAIRYNDIMPATQQRVAQEVKKCLSEYAGLNRNRFPWPTPICKQASTPVDDWGDDASVLFGRIPGVPFSATALSGMSDQWGATDCNINSSSGWWPTWRKHVFYALAPAYAPAPAPSGNGGPCANASSCLQIQSTTASTFAMNKQVVILVAGSPVGTQIRGGQKDAFATNYLELSNRDLEQRIVGLLPAACNALAPPPVSTGCSPLSNCNKATASNYQPNINDVVVYYPQ
jgi:hypothetical protein